MHTGTIARRVVAVASVFLPILAVSPQASEAGQGCTYRISLSSMGSDTAFSSMGGESFVWLDTQPGCPYTVESSDPFVIPYRSSGTGGNSTHNYIWFFVPPNFTARERSAMLRMGGQSIPILQFRGLPLVDVNRNGSADLLWHHRGDGRLAAWLMDGARRLEAVSFSPGRVADTNWVLAGGGDLNADGNVDLVWRHADGRVAAWLMDRLQTREATPLSIPVVADPDWRIRSVVDFNGDGRADILWQHQTRGLVGVWLMNGVQVLDARVVNGPIVADSNWRLVGPVVSIRGFGITREPGLLWQHDGDGRRGLWVMSGYNVLSTEDVGSAPPVPDPNWKLRSLADLNRNGASDFIWQHVDGRVAVWFDGNVAQVADLGTVPDTNWHVIGPR